MTKRLKRVINYQSIYTIKVIGMSSQQSYKIAPTPTQSSIGSRKTNQDQIQEAEVLVLPNQYPSQDSIEQSNKKSTKEDSELQKSNQSDINNKQAHKANKKQEYIDSYANLNMQGLKQMLETQETMKNQKIQANQTAFAPWMALLQNQIKSKSTGIGIKGNEDNNKKSANLNSDQQRKVLRKIRQKNKKTKSNSKSQVSFMQTRKLVEPALQIINLDLEQPDHATRPISSKVQLVANPKQVGDSASLTQPKNNFRRKNFKFEQKLTKIRDLKLQSNPNNSSQISTLSQSNTNINVKGQIIFTWDRQNINEKWAKTEMTCIQIWDGTGSIIVTVPYKMIIQRGFKLEVGNYVVIKAGQIRQKYPRNICILITEKSSIDLLPRNQIHQSQLCQPQSLCMSLQQLTNQPTTRICNIQCLVIKKHEKEYIRSSKQTELCLCKLQVYDPIENIKVIVKLWQDKANINFYYNSVVYLLRGIEVRDFKGVKEYHAVKDFNFRGLGYSRIGEYLKPIFKQRRTILKQMPSDIVRMNIRDSIIAYQHQRTKSTTPNNETNSLKAEKLGSQENITSLNKQIFSSVSYSFSVSLIRFLSLELSPLFPIKSAYCKICASPTMLNCVNRSFCSQCKGKEFKTQYAVKCEFQDGYQRYSGEILQQAGRKMFAVGKQAVQVEFLGTMNAGFREMIAKDAVGDAVRAIVAYGIENVGEEKVPAFFIVDLLPFEDDQTQESVNENICITSIASSQQPNF